jgi:peptidoglycan-associated lipoprotein
MICLRSVLDAHPKDVEDSPEFRDATRNPPGPQAVRTRLNMKTNKLMHLLAFCLALIVAGAGCRKQTSNLTPIPGAEGPKIAEETTPPLNAEPMVNTNESVGSIPLAPPSNPNDYNEDTNALAAETIHFRFDSSVVRKDEQVHIESAVAALRMDPNVKVRLEGNCDERGTEEYNRSLGERRALAVRESMVKLGIDPARILTMSYGADRPVDPGHDEAAWKKNRRVDFILLHPKQ